MYGRYPRANTPMITQGFPLGRGLEEGLRERVKDTPFMCTSHIFLSHECVGQQWLPSGGREECSGRDGCVGIVAPL